MNIYLAIKKYTKNKSEKMCFAIFAAYFGSIKHILLQKIYDMTNEKRQFKPKKKPGKIIISIDGDTFQQLEIYC